MTWRRACAGCREPIAECMGSVSARDTLRIWDGEKIIPRELCGRCIRFYRWTHTGRLRKMTRREIEAEGRTYRPFPSPPKSAHAPLPLEALDS